MTVIIDHYSHFVPHINKLYIEKIFSDKKKLLKPFTFCDFQGMVEFQKALLGGPSGRVVSVVSNQLN